MKRRKSRRNLRSSSSRRMNNTLDLVDSISVLPDSILGRILSHLPTKDAVATTLLSKRWEFMWMTVHNLEFCYEDFADEDYDGAEDTKFARFVNQVLLLHDGGFLNKFRLVWKPWFIPSQVIPWISTAISRNVHELVLCVQGPWEEDSMPEPLEMPVSVFSCGSLQYLELNGSISVPSEMVVCLPRLESLKLVSVHFHSEEDFEKLICGCPMLNYLHINTHTIDIDDNLTTTYPGEDDDFKYIISSTSLRRLVVDVGYSDLDCTRSLELEASSLDYLKLDGHIPHVFVHGSLSSLVKVDFGIQLYYGDIYDSFVEAVGAFDCAKALTLSGDAMWALSNATISLSTKFNRLTKLVAGAVCCYCSSLQDFIQSSDSLEDLTIYQDSVDVEEYDPDHDHDHDHSNWTAPIQVPRCLSNSLKKVSLKGFAGFDDEREMIGYMLRHGSFLEVMQVKYIQDFVNFGLVEEICRLPRKSPACKVKFIGAHCQSDIWRAFP